METYHEFYNEYQIYLNFLQGNIPSCSCKMIKCLQNPNRLHISRLHISFHNKSINKSNFTAVGKLLFNIFSRIESFDISLNPHFTDNCIPIFKQILIKANCLAYLSLEKIGVSTGGAINLLKSLQEMNSLKSLNFGSNEYGSKFYEYLGSIFNQNKLKELEILNLSNSKMKDEYFYFIGKPIFLKSNIKRLDLSMNLLTQKSGLFILNIFKNAKLNQIKLNDIDLKQNHINSTVSESIKQKLLQKEEPETTNLNQKQILIDKIKRANSATFSRNNYMQHKSTVKKSFDLSYVFRKNTTPSPPFKSVCVETNKKPQPEIFKSPEKSTEKLHEEIAKIDPNSTLQMLNLLNTKKDIKFEDTDKKETQISKLNDIQSGLNFICIFQIIFIN